MPTAWTRRGNPWSVLVVWLLFVVLSFSGDHFWAGAFLLALLASGFWALFAKAVPFGGMPPKQLSKEQWLRVAFFSLVCFAGLMTVLRVLSPFWR